MVMKERKEKDAESSGERELIRKAREGDKAAFQQLHDKYRVRVLNYLYRFFGDSNAAQDITQDTFIKVYTHLSRYRTTGSFSSWIFTIATNLAKNELKSAARRKKRAIEEKVSEEGDISLGDTLSSPGKSPEEEARKNELEAAIQHTIDSLSPKLRMAFILCRIEGLSYKEAASVLKCNIFAVKMRLGRAEAHIAKRVAWNKFI